MPSSSHAAHDGDIALFQQISDGLGVDVSYLSDVAQRLAALFCLDHAAVYAADAHGLAARGLDEIYQALAHLASQHHLYDLGRGLVCDAQAVNELADNAHLLQSVVYVRPAAVDKHHAHADELQEHYVLHYLGLELLVFHGVAAVLYDDDAVPILLYIGQGLNKHLRPGVPVDNSVHLISPVQVL